MNGRTLATGALGGFKKARLTWLRLRGQTPESVAEQRVVSGTSWDEFCDTLKAAGAAIVFPGTPADPLTQAEGYRYLSRLTRAGLEAFVEYGDVRAPVLRRMVHETAKMGSDNPDNYYMNASIDGGLEYLITGTRGTVDYLGFGTQAGDYGQGGQMPTTGYVEATELEIGDDGRFELVVSAREHPGNWLPMTPETGLLIVRQTFADRTTEVPAELSIELLDGAQAPAPLTCTQVDAGLGKASLLVAGASMLFAKWAKEFAGHANELPMFDPDRSLKAGGDPNIVYYHSYWRLAPDEALVIDAQVPDCEGWNFQLDNHWLESLDYRYHRIHVNKHTAEYRADGSVRIVVAHTDPGVPNWIETTGHECGAMSFRWIKAASHPQPRTRVVPVADVPGLP
ncbi:DUF1214 domain-containing protein [Gordonia sp. PP30]|uniref:DUF1214 domain-containing protein n=1 Tax=Gordonia sp. PP30 TaxID=2935861 RepID=UPI001FFE92BB|nr:DUF1214 domain-containing protein [Gordonia sp. PP30]UQE74266.1 DUF1214 domain-containing protein [Gordonia sp. PP30]